MVAGCLDFEALERLPLDRIKLHVINYSTYAYRHFVVGCL